MLVVARFENNYGVLDPRIILEHQTALQHFANQRWNESHPRRNRVHILSNNVFMDFLMDMSHNIANY